MQRLSNWSYNGICEFHITTPKTKAGLREIPMLSEVRHALLQLREHQLETGLNKSIIDGYSGFVFKTGSTKLRRPLLSTGRYSAFTNAIMKKNGAGRAQSGGNQFRFVTLVCITCAILFAPDCVKMR